MHQVICCTAKFCQHNVDWKRGDTCKDHLQSKAHVKKEEKTVVHMLSISKISGKGEKSEFS